MAATNAGPMRSAMPPVDSGLRYFLMLAYTARLPSRPSVCRRVVPDEGQGQERRRGERGGDDAARRGGERGGDEPERGAAGPLAGAGRPQDPPQRRVADHTARLSGGVEQARG